MQLLLKWAAAIQTFFKANDITDYRVKRRGKGWGVQAKKKWVWRWIGLYGDPNYGTWPDSSGALYFANLNERGDARDRQKLLKERAT